MSGFLGGRATQDVTSEAVAATGGPCQVDCPTVPFAFFDCGFFQNYNLNCGARVRMTASTNPDPLTAGQSGEACITLQNPLGTPRTVTVEFAEADFGAGVGFTKFGEEEVILPPHSLVKICVPYTPALGGTLHRCLLVTLKQAGFRDQHSQRNITLIRTGPQQLNLIDVPFVVGNSSLITQTLVVTTTVTGIDGYWMPRIFTDEGTPPPGTLGSRRFRRFHLQFAGGMPSSQTSTAAPAAPPPDYAYGDVSQAQVAIYLGGELLGGFTVELYTTRKYLPIIFKP
jgi:hypothetical protein